MSTRLISLDVLRGMTVAGMIVVNSAAAMKYDANAAVAPILLHRSWAGLTLADLVFPAFLTMVGISIPFAVRRSSAGTAPYQSIMTRTGRLLLLGFVLSNLHWLAKFDSGVWRLFGVLQRIGLVYGLSACLFLLLGARARWVLITVILVGYWPLALLPSLDGMPTDIWTRGQNLIASVDRFVLGSHRYVQGATGYDPEGLLSTLPAVAQGLIGVAIGELLIRRRNAVTRSLLLLGSCMVVLGGVWGLVFPVVKDIWSSPFVLLTSGITVLILAALHHRFDDATYNPGWASTAMLAFGSNAIAAYTLHQVTAGVVAWDVSLIPYHATVAVIGEPLAALLPILLYLALLGSAMIWLLRNRWIVKI